MLNPDGHGSSCGLIDLLGRQVGYLRLSVTDRCDLRCVYGMSEHMAVMPRKDLLELEEIERLACAFIRCGVSKVRITGGEPLVRKDIMKLFATLAPQIRKGRLKPLDVDSTSISDRGPARYARVAETGGTIGFITPLTHNFCEDCNRVRVAQFVEWKVLVDTVHADVAERHGLDKCQYHVAIVGETEQGSWRRG
ncbi:Molybdenum Cofactor Synthesis C [Bradyrhizobium erythrophlei]|nr:Molybdenum Cofactor Synthesis C [Bradyrhizobium erythrophlei]